MKNRILGARGAWHGRTSKTLWLMALAILVAAGPALAQVVTDGEYGDAPDGVNAGYGPPFDAVVGAFPTDFLTSNSRYGLNGGHTLVINDTWLGQIVSVERGAADPLDPDQVENFVDDDFDDAVAGGICPISASSVGSVTLTFDVTFAAGASGTRYVNVLLDADHDGTWDDSGAFSEWVVQDFPVSVVAGSTVTVTVGPFPFPQTAVASWLRLAVTSQTIGSVISLDSTGWDGSGEFALGEIEDYLVGNQLAFVVEAQAAAAVAQAHADALALAVARAEDHETEIAVECQSASDWALAIDIEYQNANAFALAAASAYSQAFAYSQSTANACVNTQAQAQAVASACASCGCASACGSGSASAQASASACANASAAASASATAAAQAVAAAQATASALSIALGYANASSAACGIAYADAQASATAIAAAWATADASATAAADAVAIALAAACDGDAEAAAAAAADAQAQASAAANAAALAFAHAEASASAWAVAFAYADANADALAVAQTDVSAAAAALAAAQATASANASTYASASATATSLAQAQASASAYCSSSCSCCEASTRVLTRAAVAVTVLSAKYGSSYKPPTASGAFKDVPATHWASGWIEAAVREGFMDPCRGGEFCPDDAVSRSDLPEMVLKSSKGAGYVPKAPTGMFSDVPPSDPKAGWIEEGYGDGLIGGCGGGKYCPSSNAYRSDALAAMHAVYATEVCPVSTTPDAP